MLPVCLTPDLPAGENGAQVDLAGLVTDAAGPRDR